MMDGRHFDGYIYISAVNRLIMMKFGVHSLILRIVT